MNKLIPIFNQLRPFTVGYDNVFDRFETMFEGDHFFDQLRLLPDVGRRDVVVSHVAGARQETIAWIGGLTRRRLPTCPSALWYRGPSHRE